jgi:alcohol dehydrogenase class IV
MDDTNQTAGKIQSVGKPLIALPWLNQMAKPRAQSFIFREGGLAELDSVLSQLSAQRVFLVADPVAYSASGAEAQLAGTFASRELLRFSEFEVNPKSQDVERGIQQVREFRPNVVIGFGGGTAIDLAKLISSLACQDAPLDGLITGSVPFDNETIPLIAIPTTAGTGSEATHFAVVYHEGKKFSVAHPSLLPDFSIIDPVLTFSMPKSLTASTGLDALCQAIESIWAVLATDESIQYATQSLRLSLEHLECAVDRPTPDARRGMCEAAHLAGKAINISKTTAPHALSYWLTSHYGIRHGVAVAIFLGRLLEFNAQVQESDCNDPRGPQHVRRRIATVLETLGVNDPTTGRRKLEALIARIECPISLRDIGLVNEAEIWQLIAEVNVERLSNNPRRIDASRLFDLLTAASLW